MIDEIHVENVALIEEASLIPSPGLTAITGETGAGKTALLSACKLLMGERGDKTLVREGAHEAKVEGRFFLQPHPDAVGSDCAEGADECVVSRRLTRDGRSRVSVNGSMASVSELAALVGSTIDLCGQHEHQALMTLSHHVEMLDAWGAESLQDAFEGYSRAYGTMLQARGDLERLTKSLESSTAELEEARFVLKAIDALDPEPGEYEELMADLARVEHAEALARCAHEAVEALSSEAGALDALSTARQALLRAAEYDSTLEAYASSLQDAVYVVEDVSRDMSGYAQDIEFDPADLAVKQERAGAYQSLLRSYGPDIETVMERRSSAAELVETVDGGQERLEAAQRALDASWESLREAAGALHDARLNVAPKFCECVNGVMGRLEMGSASLECRVDLKEEDRWNAAGPDAVEFLFSPGPSMQPRPLVKIASGGEVSRVMLAIKVVMGERDDIETLVFDEVDAGVGGATALSLAQVLADLSRTHQVLVVTHLAQVAALADTHYIASKDDAERPRTTLTPAEGDDRVSEIARMLSGQATERALAHARELLDAASKG